MVKFNLRPKGSNLTCKIESDLVPLNIEVVLNKLITASYINKERPHPFKIVEDYIEYSNIEKEYCELVKLTYSNIHMLKSRKEIKQNISDIINLFDYGTLTEFIEKEGYRPPTSINQEYDMNKVENNQISIARTYIYKDYFDLLKIIIPIKAIAPLIAYYIAIAPSVFINKKELLIALQFIMDSWIWYSASLERLERYIEGHVSNQANDELLSKIAANKELPVDEIYNFILANALFKRLVGAQIEKNPGSKSIINELYKAISTVTNPKSYSNITLKSGGNDEFDEGTIEAVRQSSNVPVALQTQYDFFCKDPFKLLDFLIPDNTKEDRELLNKILDKMQLLLTEDGLRLVISNLSLEITAIVINNIIPYQWLRLISRESMINLISVSAVYVNKLGLKKLSGMLLSYELNNDDLIIESNTSHLSKDIAAKLRELYPLEEEEITKLKVTYKPIVFTLINQIDSYLKKQPIVSIAPDELLEDGNRTSSTYRGIRDDIGTVILNVKGGLSE